MKRKILVLLCIAVIMALACTSCTLLAEYLNGKKPSDDTNDDCVHTYATKWSSNSTEHWHAATCEHTDLKADAASHTDSDEDGKCDVCAYEVGHTHTFADTWTTDATYHWKNATCSHTTEKGELGEHADSDSNGACDVCTVHMHVVDLYGYCTVCGDKVADVDVTDVSVIIPAITQNANKINGGSIKYSNVCTSVGENYTVSSNKNVLFILGNGAAYYKMEDRSHSSDSGSEATETLETWYELIGTNEVFSVYSVNFGELFSNSAELNNLVGYYFAVSTLASAYGPENLLAELFALSQSDAASNYVYAYDNGKYTFSFAYLYVNSDTGLGEGNHVDYYELTVSFTASSTGALAGLNVVCNAYTNSSEDEIDHDYTYDQETNTITLKDTAVADVYSFEITQTEGERTYVSEHPMSDFIPTDFDVFLDAECTEKVEGTVTVNVNKVFTLYLGNYTPAGTSISFIADSFNVIFDENSMYCGPVAISESVIINVKTAGTYTITIVVGNITKEITITANANSGSLDPVPENSVKVDITDNNAWEDLAVFTAPADGDYTFTIAEGVYLGAMGENDSTPWADFNIREGDNPPAGGSVTVSLKAGETYKFYVMSPEKNITVYIPYTVSDYTGSGSQGGSEVVIGTTITPGMNNAAFSEAEIDANSAERTLTITSNGKYAFYCDLFVSSVVGSDNVPVVAVDNFYSLVAGETYTVTFGMFNLMGIAPNTYVSINVVYVSEGGNTGSAEDKTVTEGTYIGTDYFGGTNLTVTVDGENVTFEYMHPMFGSSTVVATYAFVDGTLVLYGEDGLVLNPLAGTLTVDAEGNPTAASYNGTDYTLTLDNSSSGDEEKTPVEKVLGYYTMTGYEVIIHESWDEPGIYLFNAYNNDGDVYYGLTVVDNGDGTYTITLSLEDESLDVFGFLTQTFTATVDGDNVTLAGPELEVVEVEYPEIYTGENTVEVTQQMIDSGDNFMYKITIYVRGEYTITSNTGIYGSFFSMDFDYLGFETAVLDPGTYVVSLSVYEATVGECDVTISYSEAPAETGSDIADLEGHYEMEGYYVDIYESFFGDGYLFEVYNDFGGVCYNVSATKNDDGTYSITLSLDDESADTFGFLNETFLGYVIDGEANLIGPAYSIDYTDITVGTNTITYTEDMIQNWTDVFFDLVVENTGYYTFTLNESLYFSIFNSSMEYIGNGNCLLSQGNYVVKVSIDDNTALTEGDEELVIAYTPVSDLSAEDIVDCTVGFYSTFEYDAYILRGVDEFDEPNGTYKFNACTSDWSVDVYYLISIADYTEGVITLNLTLDTSLSETDGFGFDGKDIYIFVSEYGVSVEFPSLPLE